MARNDAADALAFALAFQRDRVTWQRLWQGTWAAPRFIVGVDRATEERPMDEQTWNTTDNVAAMLEWIRLGNAAADDDYLPNYPHCPVVVSDRKLRLFAAACCRSLFHLLTDPRSCQAVETAERFANGLASEEERFIADREATEACAGNENTPGFATGWVAHREHFLLAVDRLRSQNGAMYDRQVGATQAALLRSIVSPFSPLVLPREEKRCERCEERKSRIYEVALRRKLSAQCSDCGGRGTLPGDCPWLTPLVRSLAEAAYSSNTGRKCPYCNGGPPDLCDRCDHNSGWIGAGQIDPDTLAILCDALEEAGCCDERFIRPLRGFRPCPDQDCKGTGILNGYDQNPCEECQGSGWVRDPTPRFKGWFVLDCILERS